MLASLVYALVRPLLDLALLRCHSSTARDLELRALRHEVRVLRRRTKRIAWRPPGPRSPVPLPSPSPLAGLPRRRRPSGAGTASWSAGNG